ncbi:MAG TPA: HAD hydrolase-like protein [Acidimicrobiia bacterium]
MAPRRPLVIGFDLDMTLVDSRPGVAATLDALSAETGHAIDAAVVVGRLGPTLEDELAQWMPAPDVPAAADRYRELYAVLGVPGTALLPGASDAVAAVRRLGGRAVVVTAKFEPNAHACLAHVGLEVDAVYGWRFGPAKGETLVAEGADVYVGDTPHDVAAARAAGAAAVAVPSGPHDASELAAAGADVVLASLVDFDAWLNGWASTR